MKRRFLIIIAIALIFSFPAYGQKMYKLEDLIGKALTGSPEIRALGKEKKIKTEELRQAKAGRFPSISSQINISYVANPPGITLLPGDLGSISTSQGDVYFPQEKMDVNLGIQNIDFTFTVTADQPLFTWGKIKNAILAQEKGLEARAQSISAKTHNVSINLASHIYTLKFLNKIQDLLKEQKSTAERLIYISGKSYENGFITYSALLNTRIQIKAIELANKESQKQQEIICAEIRRLTGLSGFTAASVDYSTLSPDLSAYPIEDEKELRSLAIRNNKDLQTLRISARAQEEKLAVSRGSVPFRPDIGLHLELSYGGPDFPLIEQDWYGQDDYNMSFTVALTSALFDAGTGKSSVEEQKAVFENALISVEKAEADISYALTAALSEIELAREKILYFEAKLEADREEESLKKRSFESEAGTESDYLTAKIKVYEDEINILAEKIVFFSGFFTIQKLIGRNFPDR